MHILSWCELWEFSSLLYPMVLISSHVPCQLALFLQEPSHPLTNHTAALLEFPSTTAECLMEFLGYVNPHYMQLIPICIYMIWYIYRTTAYTENTVWKSIHHLYILSIKHLFTCLHRLHTTKKQPHNILITTNSTFLFIKIANTSSGNWRSWDVCLLIWKNIWNKS